MRKINCLIIAMMSVSMVGCEESSVLGSLSSLMSSVLGITSTSEPLPTWTIDDLVNKAYDAGIKGDEATINETAEYIICKCIFGKFLDRTGYDSNGNWQDNQKLWQQKVDAFKEARENFADFLDRLYTKWTTFEYNQSNSPTTKITVKLLEMALRVVYDVLIGRSDNIDRKERIVYSFCAEPTEPTGKDLLDWVAGERRFSKALLSNGCMPLQVFLNRPYVPNSIGKHMIDYSKHSSYIKGLCADFFGWWGLKHA